MGMERHRPLGAVRRATLRTIAPGRGRISRVARILMVVVVVVVTTAAEQVLATLTTGGEMHTRTTPRAEVLAAVM